MPNLEKLHQEVRDTQVRVTTSQGGGSGTIIASFPAGKDFHTFVLTCAHVVDSAISVRKEWDSKLGKEKKKEYRQVLNVEFFDYANVPHGRRPVSSSVDADLVAYDLSHDMAILSLRTIQQASFVAPLATKEEASLLTVGSPVVAVGAAMLHDPIVTFGTITHMGDEIDFKDYWMSNAQIIYGNSGGAMFAQYEDGYKFIGIPSRIAVAGWSTPITHLGYFSPITRVYEFLDEQLFHFLIPGHSHTESTCEKERKHERDRENRLSTGDFSDMPLYTEEID